MTHLMMLMDGRMTQASDDAEVVNLSIGPVPRDILGAADYRMDRNDEDYSKYGKRFDALIDCHNVLIIQAAGNESKGDTDRYSLGWGSDSYNAIVVGLHRVQMATRNLALIMWCLLLVVEVRPLWVVKNRMWLPPDPQLQRLTVAVDFAGLVVLVLQPLTWLVRSFFLRIMGYQIR